MKRKMKMKMKMKMKKENEREKEKEKEKEKEGSYNLVIFCKSKSTLSTFLSIMVEYIPLMVQFEISGHLHLLNLLQVHQCLLHYFLNDETMLFFAQ